MIDDGDLAQAREEAERVAAIGRHLARPASAGSLRCRRCDDEIPEARRRAVPSATLCVDCAGLIERRRV